MDITYLKNEIVLPQEQFHHPNVYSLLEQSKPKASRASYSFYSYDLYPKEGSANVELLRNTWFRGGHNGKGLTRDGAVAVAYFYLPKSQNSWHGTEQVEKVFYNLELREWGTYMIVRMLLLIQ